MKTSFRSTLFLALLMGLTALLALAPAASAASGRACGELARVGESGPSIVTVRASSTSCREARRVLERYLAGSAPGAWEQRAIVAFVRT